MNNRIYLTLLTIIFSSCYQDNSEKETNVNKENKDSIETNIIENKNDSSNRNIDSLFIFLESRNLKPNLFRDSVYAKMTFDGAQILHDKLFTMKNDQKGVYYIYYVMEGGKHKTIDFANIYVSRPISKTRWMRFDTTESVIAFEIYTPKIQIRHLLGIGSKNFNIKKKYGEPTEVTDSMMTYFEAKDLYDLKLDFYISSDTVSKIIFKKLKK